MVLRIRTLAFLLLSSVVLTSPLHAQYLYIDANGDGVHSGADTMTPNGSPLTIDVWLDRTHNKNGSLATCDTGDGDLAVWNSYVVHANVVGGAASFTNFVNHVTVFPIAIISGNQFFASNSGGMAAGAAGMAQSAPSPIKLFTVTVTGLSGAPTLAFVPMNSLDANPTAFGTPCSGNDFDNTYKLGTDWFDTDGLGAAGDCGGNCSPSLSPIANMTVNEGVTASQTIHASDPEGMPLQFQKVSGPFYMTVATTNAAAGTGLITLMPGFFDATSGTSASVRANDGSLNSNTESFLITVANINRAPVSNPGGPYSGVTAVPVAFDGSASADPDGDALTYFWDFGDLASATGSTASHTYAAARVYTVTLVVQDGTLTGVGRTTATITEIFQARAFTTKANRLLRLGSGKPYWTIQIEPVGGSFDIGQVAPGTIRMKSPGTGSVSEIGVVLGKTTLQGDADGNGVPDIGATFAKSDLKALFSNLNGSTTVTVTFEGGIASGGTFRAQTDIGVVAGGGNPVAVLPNPLHRTGEVWFTVAKPGRVHVALFDVSGRMVRVLDDRVMAGGAQSCAIDGRTRDGAPLASGVYYVRVSSEEGTRTQRVAILK
jgi:PKD repeat protein